MEQIIKALSGNALTKDDLHISYTHKGTKKKIRAFTIFWWALVLGGYTAAFVSMYYILLAFWALSL